MPEMVQITLSELKADPDRFNVEIENDEAIGAGFEELILDDSRIATTRLSGARFSGAKFRDCTFEEVELSGAHFDHALFSNSSIKNCKAVDAEISNATITDVVFESCIFTSTSFRFAHLLRVKFIDCRLDETEFVGAKLRDVQMERCHIENTDFSHADLTEMDMQTSQIISIKGIAGLTGSIISSNQAMTLGSAFARHLGITVGSEAVASSEQINRVVLDFDYDDISEEASEEDSVVIDPGDAKAHLAQIRDRLKH